MDGWLVVIDHFNSRSNIFVFFSDEIFCTKDATILTFYHYMSTLPHLLAPTQNNTVWSCVNILKVGGSFAESVMSFPPSALSQSISVTNFLFLTHHPLLAIPPTLFEQRQKRNILLALYPGVGFSTESSDCVSFGAR